MEELAAYERRVKRERAGESPPPSDDPPPAPPPDSHAARDAPPPTSDTETVKGEHPNAPKLPVIKVGTNIREVVDQAQSALLARGGIYATDSHHP